MAVLTEADTCRKYVLPKLYALGWDDDQISEQKTFTDGRIVVAGNKTIRKPQKRADYLLRYRPDFAIAVVEAKAVYKNPGDGLQQAKDYAQILGLRFAYSTNGRGIIEHDFITGRDNDLEEFPSPDDLWERLKHAENIPSEIVDRLLTPYYHLSGKSPRYYQEIAINRSVQAILSGKPRVLLTLATGTGKTVVAFQICWKLWSTRWNRTGEHRRPRILYLADRNVLVDDPKDKIFTPFGDARHKIEGEAVKSREMYFSTYQAIARDERRPGLYREYAPDFFDLVIVDECHRGSARDESNWREILEYFEPAYQLGMTATPLRQDNRDTYRYFGNPIYTYSLRQGIDDGFLAPYRVHRIVPSVDATGWRPTKGQLDRYGREIPDAEYGTPDFERRVVLKVRTEAIARNLTEFLRNTDRLAKTIVFCVDQEHAEDMRKALNNFNTDLAKEHADYVVRVTADEGKFGRGHLDRFMELETIVPTIVTTSQLLTTGVDVQTCKNVVLARVINSMTEFKQIIGRGTRVRDDYGKLYFNILDYTGSATRLFADPDFDGEPALITEEEMNEAGEKVKEEVKKEEEVIVDVWPPTEVPPGEGPKNRGESSMWMTVGWKSRRTSSMSLTRRGSSFASSSSPTTLARRSGACTPRPQSSARSGQMRRSALQSLRRLKGAASRSRSSSRRQGSPMPTRLTSSATWRTTPRSGHAGNGRTDCEKHKRSFSRFTAKRPARSWTKSSTSMWITGRRSSNSLTFLRCRPFPSAAQCPT